MAMLDIPFNTSYILWDDGKWQWFVFIKERRQGKGKNTGISEVWNGRREGTRRIVRRSINDMGIKSVSLISNFFCIYF